ncbi:HEAT repeat domain-containing protein [Streptomyces sp. SID10815]|uniref:HEAT repeat domain-containing protein n=1 Tax=Streptomyces sp. SID10815 TaxID=2706027 RepID=UPI0013C5EB5F|nr:HEAT repeat domain-containing protein [Streptomyces sp. SID10815]NEA46697.1 hypothetical protein [Streptomyces sp. SID10815]
MTSGLEAALTETSSPSWTQRVRAGRGLASFTDVPEAAEALVRLLLDVEDTVVTRQTAEALARVGTLAAVRSSPRGASVGRRAGVAGDTPPEEAAAALGLTPHEAHGHLARIGGFSRS